MKITFLGATHQVTGSRTLVEWLDGRYFLVDYGMEQGEENEFEQQELPVAPSAIEHVFVTHAHIDHTGLLPLLYKQGFRGIIHSTPETENLCSIMLADSAHIQETDAVSETKKNLRKGGPTVEPLYTKEDVEAVMKLFQPCEYGKVYMIDEGLSVRFTDAGHLLGSSFIEFFLEEEGVQKTLVCSGDVGNTNQPIICDPKSIAEADYLLIESTYGTRLHERKTEPIPALVGILRRTFQRGGTVVIPSFAVGRTQELLYYFREIKQHRLLPEYQDFPVYVDSPLASEATAIFLQCSKECLDEDATRIMDQGQNPIWFDGLRTTVSADDSKALNDTPESKVIISSGGMCEGGRIRHHLKHTIWNPRNTIMFAGYQAVGTLGRTIYEGAKTVKIYGEVIDVNAEIVLLEGMSGHADKQGLLNWIDGFTVRKPGFVFVNHGDDPSCTAFAQEVTDRFGIPANAPYSGCEYDLAKGEWIRLTEPVRRKKKAAYHDSGAEQGSSPSKIRNKLFLQLRAAVEALDQYTMGLAGHSNDELSKLTQKIRDLIHH